MTNRKPCGDPISSQLLKGLRPKPVFLNPLCAATDFLPWSKLSGIYRYTAVFTVLRLLVPRANKPNMAVIVLTQLMHRGVRELARTNGAYVCFVKRHTTGEDLDRAIQRAVALVGQMLKEDRYRNI
jgi:hypothetical protein